MDAKGLKRATPALIVAALAVFMALWFTCGNAMAYFTSYAEAAGGQEIKIEAATTTPDEPSVTAEKKVVKVRHDEGATACWVRVQATPTENCSFAASDKWHEQGGWYYYDEPLAAGEETTELNIALSLPEDGADSFKVLVTYETTIKSNSDGTAGVWDSQAVAYEGVKLEGGAQ